MPEAEEQFRALLWAAPQPSQGLQPSRGSFTGQQPQLLQDCAAWLGGFHRAPCLSAPCLSLGLWSGTCLGPRGPRGPPLLPTHTELPLHVTQQGHGGDHGSACGLMWSG